MDKAFPRNMVDFMCRFTTNEACAQYLMALRWPDGFICPACGGEKGWPTARVTICCAACNSQTSLTAGTILHNTRVPLRSWFMAMWLVCTQKRGMSAADLQRELGLGSYRTGWLMLQKLRQAMVRAGRDQLSGAVEVDETYLGGKEEEVRGRQLLGKKLVVIAVEMEGRKVARTRLRHIPDASADSLVSFVTDCVKTGTVVHTDGWQGYAGLAQAGYKHQVTAIRDDKDLGVEAFPHVHLVASLLKRWLGATHQGKVGPKHLQGYLDEFSFRFNRRRSRYIGKIFHRLAEQLCLRKAKTYQEFIGD